MQAQQIQAQPSALPGLDQLESILETCLSIDNAQRTQAEVALKQVSRRAEAIPVFVHILQTSGNVGVKQLAAVQLRKRVTYGWNKVAPDAKEAVKGGLLDVVTKEPSREVRKAAIEATAAVAGMAIAHGNEQWPNLLNCMSMLSTSQHEEHREAGLMMFCSLTESVDELLKPHFGALQKVIMDGLTDASPKVRRAAVQAVRGLQELTDDKNEPKVLSQFIPALVNEARQSLQTGNEEGALAVFEILSEFAEFVQPVFGTFVAPIVTFCLEVTEARSLDLNVREQALMVIQWTVRHKPKTLTKSGTVPKVLEALCRMCSEADPPDHDDSDQLSARRFAAVTLDEIAMQLSDKHIFPGVLAFAQHAIQQAADADARVGACVALSAIAEGCCDTVAARIQEVLQVLLAGVQDLLPIVRKEAAYAIGMIADFSQQEVLENHAIVLPAIFNLLDDEIADIQYEACVAFDAICENLGKDITPYIHPLMEKMVNIAKSGSPTVRLSALSAISSIALAADDGQMKPYGTAVLQLLESFMQLTDKEGISLRYHATECMSLVAQSLGKEFIAPMLPHFMEIMLKGLELGSIELREYTFGAFGILAKLMGPDFAPYVPHVLPPAFAACRQEDSESDESDGKAESDDDDSDEDEALQRIKDSFSRRSGAMEETAAAMNLLGICADALRAGFAPHLQEALACTVLLADYVHEAVREQAFDAMSHLLVATQAAFPASPSGACSAEVSHILSSCIPMALAAVESDQDKEVVASAINMAALSIKNTGAANCATYIQPFADAIEKLLKVDAVCQIDELEEDSDDSEGDGGGRMMEEGDEDSADEDLLVAAMEALPVLAAGLGPAAYAPIFFHQHFKPLLKLASGSASSLHASAIGALAETALNLGAAAAPAVDTVLPLVLRQLASKDETNRRNAAYCAGCFCQAAREAMLSHLPRILQALHPLFGEGENAGTRDNACSAVCRMLTSAGDVLPLDQVLPVLMGALPLTEDFDEAEVVYGALCGLVTSAPLAHIVAPFIPAIMQVFGKVAMQEEVPEAVRRSIALTVVTLHAQFGGELEALLGALPLDQRSAMASLAAA